MIESMLAIVTVLKLLGLGAFTFLGVYFVLWCIFGPTIELEEDE